MVRCAMDDKVTLEEQINADLEHLKKATALEKLIVDLAYDIEHRSMRWYLADLDPETIDKVTKAFEKMKAWRNNPETIYKVAKGYSKDETNAFEEMKALKDQIEDNS